MGACHIFNPKGKRGGVTVEGALHVQKGVTGLWGLSPSGANSSFQEPN